MACSTASIASARMALAMRSCAARESGAAVDVVLGFMALGKRVDWARAALAAVRRSGMVIGKANRGARRLAAVMETVWKQAGHR